MFLAPKLVHLARGSAEGLTSLNAFDNALLDAGIHNLNLIQVSSIVPKGAVFGDLPQIETGTLTPTVYSYITSNTPGEIVSACVGAGLGSEGGVLMEFHHEGHGADAENVVRRMIEEGFARRSWTLDRVVFTTAEHKVDRLGCAVAAAVLWNEAPGDESRTDDEGR
jgi:arginine decarboxylase